MLADHHAWMPKKPSSAEQDRQAGLRLRVIRLAHDAGGPINQEFFAKKIGTTRTALANWEGGKLPDVRAMVRLQQWMDVPLDWIYLGQTGRLDYEIAERVIEMAASVGAVVGAPAAEWPMEVERRPDIAGSRPAARVPARRKTARTLHEKPTHEPPKHERHES